jgi:RNA polymerase sigma factor (sigma-70 family)
MKAALTVHPESDIHKNETVKKAFQQEKSRLLAFIKKRVNNQGDAEDILQDVFYQFTESLSLPASIEKVTAWLFRVARNKIIDRYRKRKTESLDKHFNIQEEDDSLSLLDVLSEPQDSPENVYTRELIWEQLAIALDELPVEQREVFVMHELEGKSFKDISQATGVTVNTLLSRKRYAVLYLRQRLRDAYNDLLNV